MSARSRPSEVSLILSGEAPPTPLKPSTKVHQPSGGFTNNIFGSDAPPTKPAYAVNPKRYESQIAFGETAPAPIKTSVPIDPRRYQTQISFAAPAAEAETPVVVKRTPNPVIPAEESEAIERPATRRDPNRSSLADVPEDYQPPSTTVSGKKIWSGKSNESHFVISDQVAQEAAEEPVKPNRKNHNETSEAEVETVVVKPSTRVLNPPGGRSNFILG